MIIKLSQIDKDENGVAKIAFWSTDIEETTDAEDKITVTIKRKTLLDPIESTDPNFIVYENLTEEIVLEWINNKLDESQTQLINQLAQWKILEERSSRDLNKTDPVKLPWK